MKVKLIFESTGPYLLVESESEEEDKMMNAAFADNQLQAKAEFNRSWGGAGYTMHSDRRATLRVGLFA